IRIVPIITGRLDQAAIMSLIQPARNNGHDPYAYLKDVLTRLPSL
ncbi:transposase domain-containing protein, partial [Klebsiella pneumoniae]